MHNESNKKLPPAPIIRYLIAWSFLWALLLIIVLVFYGRPDNEITWICVLSGGSLFIAAVFVKSRWVRVSLKILFFLYYFLIFFPYDSYSLLDFHDGREGVETWPVSYYPILRFSKKGVNTAILEEYQPRPAEWRYIGQRTSGFGLGRWKDGFDAVTGGSLIRKAVLPDVLGILPHGSAKHKVLACFTDPDNIVRAHQEQLLLLVWGRGFPPGLDSNSWWEHHKGIFEPEYNPTVAARLVHGLFEKFSDAFRNQDVPDVSKRYLFMLKHQVGGSVIGGDPKLAIAIRQRIFDGDETIPPEAWINRIAWWPESPVATQVGVSSAKGG